jgi:hypothetical protein
VATRSSSSPGSWNSNASSADFANALGAEAYDAAAAEGGELELADAVARAGAQRTVMSVLIP